MMAAGDMELRDGVWLRGVPVALRPQLSTLRDHCLQSSAVFADVVNEVELLLAFLAFTAQPAVEGSEEEELSPASVKALRRLVLQQLHHEHLASGAALLTMLPTNSTRSELLRAHRVACAEFDDTTLERGTPLALNCTPPAKLFAQFGGQGVTYLDELAELLSFAEDAGVAQLVRQAGTALLAELAALQADDTAAVAAHYSYGLDLVAWLAAPVGSRPHAEYLQSAPISLPLICLTQLCNFLAFVAQSNVTWEKIRGQIVGATGHSQGLVSAVVLAGADSPSGFLELAVTLIRFLFWLGHRVQAASDQLVQAGQNLKIPPLPRSSKPNNQGVPEPDAEPTPMLAIAGLSPRLVKQIVSIANRNFPPPLHLAVALVNGPQSCVVSGAPRLLAEFRQQLALRRVAPGESQNNVAPRNRKLDYRSRFLPVSSAFHIPTLSTAVDEVALDCSARNIVLNLQDLDCTSWPVLSTRNGCALDMVSPDLLKTLASLIVAEPVDWPRTIVLAKRATFVMDFGPGSSSSAGLSARILHGAGPKVVMATYRTLNYKVNATEPPNLVNWADFLTHDERHELFCPAPNWMQDCAATLTRMPLSEGKGTVLMSTRYTKLTGRPPIMVAGMTPTTSVNGLELVAAASNAGYTIELAAGGFSRPAIFTERIETLSTLLKPGTGIVLNLLYLNAKQWAFQFPLALDMRRRGLPIESITIAAGVPTVEAATTIVASARSAGLHYLSFKPGTRDAILSVLAIARENPDIAFVLQWTGGRGGGHHSYEDVHQPILSTYSLLREATNLVLVFGSGLGSADQALPYLTGHWALAHGFPAMPFDAILLASRVMACREAATAPEVKKILAATPGIAPDQEVNWDKTFDELGVGGIITVVSELGESIHKVATRGVRLWREFDTKYFCISSPQERAAKIAADKDYITARLNADGQKQFFGRKASGAVVDLEEMTYGEVVDRMLHFFFVPTRRHEEPHTSLRFTLSEWTPTGRWLDRTFLTRVQDFLLRTQERFGASPVLRPSDINQQLHQDPEAAVAAIFVKHIPEARNAVLRAEDVGYFLTLCATGGKPVNFIPVIDGALGMLYKKDSLWYSEDLDGIPDRDADRVCILQGPVSTFFVTSENENESVVDLLENMHDEMVKTMQQKGVLEQPSEFAERSLKLSATVLDLVDVTRLNATLQCVTVVESASVVGCSWSDVILNLKLPAWMHALCLSNHIADGQRWRESILPQLFHIQPGQQLFLESGGTSASASHIRLCDVGTDTSVSKVAITLEYLSSIGTTVVIRVSERPQQDLILHYRYEPAAPSMLQELPAASKLTTEQAITNFYGSLWGVRTLTADDPVKFKLTPEHVTAFSSAIGRPGQATADLLILIAWQPLTACLCAEDLCLGNLLHLVHQSNDYRVQTGTLRLAVGDELVSTFQLASVEATTTGTKVTVQGIVERVGLPLLQVEMTSTFFIRGSNLSKEALLGPKPPQSLESFESAAAWLPDNGYIVGAFDLAYAPKDNAAYARASTDCNPIHCSRYFAALAHLPEPIVHGMWTLANARRVVVEQCCQGEDARCKAFTGNFLAMVFNGQALYTQTRHTGMLQGCKIIDVSTYNIDNEEVFSGRAIVEEQTTAYLFTGQGSAEVGMGMALYETSPAARTVWQAADAHLQSTFAFSILDIVRNNPRSLKVRFRGRRGATVRATYMALQTMGPDGSGMQPLLPDITATSEEYVFSAPQGLLFATQFTQCALVLQEKAAFEDMAAHQLLPSSFLFAGHSLGEYASLTAAGSFLSIQALVEIVFLRGLVMQKAVHRDSEGRSDFGMVAANPLRVGPQLTPALLHDLVVAIGKSTLKLLEIVNYNVEGLQYVVAGHLEPLEVLRVVLSAVADNPARDWEDVIALGLQEVAGLPRPLVLQRGRATIPLPGIDVPFHSRYLQPGVPAFRACLRAKIPRDSVQASMVHLLGSYIPNVVAKPFELTWDFVHEVWACTKSQELQALLDLPKASLTNDPQVRLDVAYILIIELLAYQFASPVRWIETLHFMLTKGQVTRLVEIGPAPTLTNMALVSVKSGAYGPPSLRQALFFGRDTDHARLYYNQDGEDRKQDVRDHLQHLQQQLAQKQQEQTVAMLVPVDSIATAPAPVLAYAPPLISAQALLDQALPTIQVLRILLAVKLKKNLKEVDPSASIRALSAGRSAVANEILGDMQQEFGNAPDAAAEMTLDELAKTLGAGYTPLGSFFTKLIHTMLGAKMPAGFPLSAVRSLLGVERGLGPKRLDAVLAVGLTMQPVKRLTSDTEVHTWLHSITDAYGQLINETIPRGGSTGYSSPAGAAFQPSNGPPIVNTPLAPVPDVRVPALDVIRVLLALKLQLPLTAVSPDTTIKALAGGKSALQNELLGDFEQEFSLVPDSAAELPLTDLAASVAQDQSLGKVSQAIVNKMLSTKMPGGFALTAAKALLSTERALGPERTDGVLLHATTMAPAARLETVTEASLWLHKVVDAYATANGLSIPQQSTAGNMAATLPVTTATGTPIQLHQMERLARDQITSYLHFLGEDGMQTQRQMDTQKDAVVELSTRLDALGREHGEYYQNGVQPVFDALKARVFDSSWNWVRTDALELLADLAQRKVWFDQLECTARRTMLVNRATPALLDMLRHAEQSGHWRLGLWLQKLCASVEDALYTPPRYVAMFSSKMPHCQVSDTGAIEYSEQPRPSAGSALAYVQQAISRFVQLKVPAAAGQFTVCEMATYRYLQALSILATSGTSFAGQVCLVTGAGEGSIAIELVKVLLEGGAHVILTTSSLNQRKAGVFQKVFQHCGARGSLLRVVPFNQGSLQDVEALINYIYHTLLLDVDVLVPFAAIAEEGTTIAELRDKSELAHRIMMTNVIRLVGAVQQAKAVRQIVTNPVVVILPLSPNHGLFGFDGLYAESKMSLESLLFKRDSENWGDYVNLFGAVIGWTRGTGLMAGNDMTSPAVEAQGCLTFSTAEMGFLLAALLHPSVRELADNSAVLCDLSGGFSRVTRLHEVVSAFRNEMQACSAARKREREAAGAIYTPVDHFFSVITRARYDYTGTRCPPVLAATAMAALPKLEGMVDLSEVVVVAGFGEIGPWGSSRTRWEMEAHGEFSLEGCIELAWYTGLITFSQEKSCWVDMETKEPVTDTMIKQRYERHLLSHCGIRVIDPQAFEGYDPARKEFLHQVVLERDMDWLEMPTITDAMQFVAALGSDKVDVQAREQGVFVRLKRGAVLSIPRALRFDRLVCGQLPTGWDPRIFGLSEDIIQQVDPVTLYTLVATAEALICAGVPDPYEFYEYVHVSAVGNTIGSGMGGMRSLQRIFHGRKVEKDMNGDTLQETFINTVPAWVNMLLLSASGPIKSPVGACATSAQSVELGFETIKAGKADVVVCGGVDDFSEEGSYEFAQMKATSDSNREKECGREPGEMCRPTTTTRAGFMEAQGAGVQVLMRASVAVAMGCPIYGIIANTATAMDKEGRSVPAPGQGILTTAREQIFLPPTPYLDVQFRRELMEMELAHCRKLAFAHPEDSFRMERSIRQRWGADWYLGRTDVSPLKGALAVWGLTIDDIRVASFHGTGTKANDLNESEVTQQQMTHLGRAAGNPLLCICQKWLTGHPKGAAAAWMLNGLLQTMNLGIVPGNRNADNIAQELAAFDHILYPNTTLDLGAAGPIKAGLLKSFGFGQAGAEILVVHSSLLLAAMTATERQAYLNRREKRACKGFVALQRVLTGQQPLVSVKTAPPYSNDLQNKVYLDPTARAAFDPKVRTWLFSAPNIKARPSPAPATALSDRVPTSGTEEASVLMAALRKGEKFGVPHRQEDAETAGLRPRSRSQPPVFASSVESSKANLEATMLQAAESLVDMNDKGIGIDVESVSTFETASNTFIDRNFSTEEQLYCKSAPHPAASFAGRWAAKEAVIKAISSMAEDTRSLWRGAGAPLRDIEILPSPSGAPTVKLHGHALAVAQTLGVKHLKVSISHASEHAVAQAYARGSAVASDIDGSRRKLPEAVRRSDSVTQIVATPTGSGRTSADVSLPTSPRLPEGKYLSQNDQLHAISHDSS